jgi:uncharacterized protein (UPF0548 family)
MAPTILPDGHNAAFVERATVNTGTVLRLGRPTDELLHRVLKDQEARPLTYTEIGATAGSDPLPAGFHHDRFGTDLGADDDGRATRAGKALREWVPQRGAGIRVFPGDPVAPDQSFVLALPLPGAGWALAPGRVVYLLDEPERSGFAYGTLPGHPERGEEAFIVVRANGRVRFEVIAFSRPRDPLVRLAKPLARALQVRTIKSYLTAMEAAIR